MKMIGVAFIYIAWYLFVFAMCYFFSPWFVFLILLQFIFRVLEPTMELFSNIIFHKIRRKIKSIVDPIIIEKIEYEAIIDEIKRRLSN